MPGPYTTQEKADLYDNLIPLLEAMHEEFEELSKKKPDAVLNKRKVDIVNRLLTDVLRVLDGEPSRAYLESFDPDDLPQNSDVALMLGQIVAAMAAFRSKYHHWDSVLGDNSWSIEKAQADRRRTR